MTRDVPMHSFRSLDYNLEEIVVCIIPHYMKCTPTVKFKFIKLYFVLNKVKMYKEPQIFMIKQLHVDLVLKLKVCKIK